MSALQREKTKLHLGFLSSFPVAPPPWGFCNANFAANSAAVCLVFFPLRGIRTPGGSQRKERKRERRRGGGGTTIETEGGRKGGRPGSRRRRGSEAVTAMPVLNHHN